MILKSVTIENFKSIENISVPLLSYGFDKSQSNSMILVGINESGKSNILQAIDAVNHNFKNFDYETIYCKLSEDKSKSINVKFHLNSASLQKYFETFLKKINVPPNIKNILSEIKLLEGYRKFFTDKDNKGYDYYGFIFDSSFIWHNLILDDESDITKLRRIAPHDSNLSIEEANSLLGKNEILLDSEIFEELFINAINKELYADFPKIIYWKSSHEHLINNDISISEFQTDTNISIPLKNIFKIYGCKTDDDIRNTIEQAFRNSENKSELEDSLSDYVTTHINNIWKEHKIKLIIKFDGDLCKVHVVDLSSKYKYYSMKNRSDGFKQFVSLMLSLSAENDSNNLKDSIILLDEPEVHLHPSGIRYLRDEILKIGKNNHVIVSTHSHYLVDTEVPERHWIVEKNKKTTIKQLSETASFADDEVLSKAFGLALMKELIPNNILIVEGFGDKEIFNHILKLSTKQLTYTIKVAGGCSKVYSTASILNDEKIKAIILVDDDEEGQKVKKEIIKNLRSSFTADNVFTLRDILPSLPGGSTIEDLYPIEFVNNFVSKKLEQQIDFVVNQPIIFQLKKIDSTFNGTANKEKLEKLKTELAETFLDTYKTLKQIKDYTEKYFEFSEMLIEKIKGSGE